MVAANAFEQWQKDDFFLAAEAVQESTDIMESVYRLWVREKMAGFTSEDPDELLRELQIALGTAKWQLDELRKAISSSHGKYVSEESVISRRREFIITLEGKVDNVEKALRDSFIEEGKKPLRWVQLDEAERDDLAVFLSCSPQNYLVVVDDGRRSCVSQLDTERAVSSSSSVCKETMIASMDGFCIDKEVVNETPRSKKRMASQVEQVDAKAWSLPDTGEWKIVIDHEEDIDRTLLKVKQEYSKCPSTIRGFVKSVESSVNSYLFRNSFHKPKDEENTYQKKGLPSYLNSMGLTRFGKEINHERSHPHCKEDSKVPKVQQLVRKVSGLKLYFRGSQYFVQYGRPLHAIFLLFLTIFLVVPFVLYST